MCTKNKKVKKLKVYQQTSLKGLNNLETATNRSEKCSYDFDTMLERPRSRSHIQIITRRVSKPEMNQITINISIKLKARLIDT